MAHYKENHEKSLFIYWIVCGLVPDQRPLVYVLGEGT